MEARGKTGEIERYFFTEPSVAHVEDVLEGIDVMLVIRGKRSD
jgi:hypothetical protein